MSEHLKELAALECANQFAANRSMAVDREWVRGWDACIDYVRAALSTDAASAAQARPTFTPGMLQDDSRALASKPDARMHAREAAAITANADGVVETQDVRITGLAPGQVVSFAPPSETDFPGAFGTGELPP